MANIGITRGAVANEMGQGEEDISFVCQRCLQPLRINPSFYSMNEHTLADLSLPMSPAPEINLESGTVSWRSCSSRSGYWRGVSGVLYKMVV